MNNETMVDLTTVRELRDLEASLRKEIQTAKDDIIRDLQKKEEYLTRLIRILIAKIDALEQEKQTVLQEKPKTKNKRLFSL